MSSGKVVLSLLTGIAAGAILGVLFAPDKGSATRKKISKKTEEYTGELEDKFDQLIDSISRKLEAVKDGTINMGEKGKSKAGEAASN